MTRLYRSGCGDVTTRRNVEMFVAIDGMYPVGAVVLERERLALSSCARCSWSRARAVSLSESLPGTWNSMSCAPALSLLSVVESFGYRSVALWPGATSNRTVYASLSSTTDTFFGG